MNKYYLYGKIDNEEYDQILLDIDNGIEVKLTVASDVSEDDIVKIAALGQPIFISAKPDTLDFAKRILAYDPECVVIELPITKQSFQDSVEFLQELATNPSLKKVSVLLMDPDKSVSEIDWNILIINCLDHGINLCWQYESATGRYSEYLRSIA